VELPTTSATTGNNDPVVGEECWKTDPDTAVGEGARSLDLIAAISLPEAVATMLEVLRRQDILPTAKWVSGYSKNPVTQQR
jgi:hypothetical protein